MKKLCNTNRNIFLLLTIISLILPCRARGFHNILTIDDPVMPCYHPFRSYTTPVFGAFYTNLYGLNDFHEILLGIGFPCRGVNFETIVNASGVSDVHRNFKTFFNLSSDYAKKIYWQVAASRNGEMFAGDDRTHLSYETGFVLGCRLFSGLYPFGGFKVLIEKRLLLPHAGLIVKNSQLSRIGVLLVRNKDSSLRLVACHGFALHKRLEAKWAVCNQPVQFSIGLCISLSKRDRIHAEYNAHPSLGGSFQTGLCLLPWAN